MDLSLRLRHTKVGASKRASQWRYAFVQLEGMPRKTHDGRDDMIDSVVKNQIEESLRFLRSGDRFSFDIDEHAMIAVRLVGDGVFLIACETCKALCEATTHRPYLAVHRHIAPPEAGTNDIKWKL